MHIFTSIEIARLLAADEETISWLKNQSQIVIVYALFLLYEDEKWEALEKIALHEKIKPKWTSFKPTQFQSSTNLLALSMYFINKM